MIARWRRLWRAGEKGQALAEQGILLATLVAGMGVGGAWLMHSHPQMLQMYDIAIRSYYFVLSLPLP